MPYNEKSRENLKSYKPYSELTEEERKKQHENSVKGGLARGEQMRKEKTLKETALKVLETRLTRDNAVKMLGDKAELISDDDLTIQSVLTVRLIDALLQEGNCKAYELLRDTSGQKPVDASTIDLSADIMTPADRKLLENITRHLSATDGKIPD